MAKSIKWDDVTIQSLFGHEAAEDEEIDRLRAYYFKGSVYERVVADLPLRILVGHKGVGKSALFTVARHEDKDEGIISLLLRPDDVREVDTHGLRFLEAIRAWKEGLLRIIRDRCVATVGNPSTEDAFRIGSGIKLIEHLTEAFKPIADKVVDRKASYEAVAKKFLAKKKIRVYIDDLDRAWDASKESIDRMSTLLNAMRDLTKEQPGLQFRVSLRADVYFLVRTADESTDKIEGSVVWLSWTNHEILALLVKRVRSYFGENLTEETLVRYPQHQLAAQLDCVMVDRFRGHGGWSNIPTYRMLMSLIRRRPRDLVKLCASAAHSCRERQGSTIATEDFKSVFAEYSQGRLQDTINEYRSELPAIEALLLGMRPTRRQSKHDRHFTFDTAELMTKLGEIIEHQRLVFYGGQKATKKRLAAFLYRINFLTARRQAGEKIERQYFEEKQYLATEFADFGYDWEVHPAYRWALQPDEKAAIYKTLDSLSE